MSIVTIDDKHLTNIANAIRQKNGAIDKYNPSEMANAIKNIEGGSEPILQNVTVSPKTTEQTITPSGGYDGIGQIKVNAVTSSIDGNIKAENIKKGVTILGVTGILEIGSSGSVEGTELELSTYEYVNKSIREDGTVRTYSGWYMSEHINCEGYSSVKYQLPAYNDGSTALVGIAFYDIDKAFIKGLGKYQADEYFEAPWALNGYADIIIVGENAIPTNAVYMRISKNSQYDGSFVTLIKGDA